ncbi:tetratricopeptide repeat protein, partial [candidate division GN15 bacterium]|nr:tetratricopeptide repeat protein [candidate division GN15 bacterium]
METYRISSKLRERDHEYLIQTTNDASEGKVLTDVFVDGLRAETVACPHPVDITAQDVLSLVKVTHGEKKKELETLLQAFASVLEKGDADVQYQLGTAFFYKRFYREAVELFESALTLSPDHHQALNYLGQSRLFLGDLPRAREAAEAAVEARPTYADYRNNLGEVYLALEEASEAQEQFRQATSINMYYGDAYFNLALAYGMEAKTSGDHDVRTRAIGQMVESLNKAAMIDSQLRDMADYKSGFRALQTGDFSRAVNSLMTVRETRREDRRQQFSTYYMRFLLHPGWVTERAVQERIEFLEEAIGKNPGYVDLQAELGQCYLEQARLIWEKGLRQMHEALELNPSLVRVRETIELAEEMHA